MTVNPDIPIASAALAAAPEGVMIADRRSNLVSLNRRFVEMWRIPETVDDSGSLRDVLDAMEDRLARPDAFIARVRDLHRHQTESAREDVMLKDGRVFELYTAPLLRNGSGKEFLGRAWFFRDVTPLRDVRTAIHDDEKLLHALIDQDIAGILIYGPDRAIRYVNPEFAKMLGYSVAEVMGCDFAQFVAEADRAETVALFHRVAKGEMPSARVAVRVLAKQGGTVDVIGQMTAASYRGEPAVIGIALDVTELRRTEKALEESEGLYRTVVSALAEGVLVVDVSRTIVTCNSGAARILGLKETEIIGRQTTDAAWQMTAGDGTPLTTDTHPSALALVSGKTSCDTLVGVTRADGARIWLSVNAQPLFHKGEAAPHAVVCSFMDVTPHKIDQDTLTRVNHALTVLIRANEVLVRTHDEQALLDRMCATMVEVGGYRLAWIGLIADKPVTAVRAVAHAGDDIGMVSSPPSAQWDALAHHEAVTEAVLQGGKPHIEQDLAQTNDTGPGHALIPVSGSRIVLPLIVGADALGVLALYAAEPGAFTPDAVQLLVQLADDLAYGIAALRERARREDGEAHLRRSMEATVQAIASTLEMRDPYTAGHQRDVAKLAVAIAREIAVPEDEIEGIYLAAIVHDVGKIRIPIDILSKPGALTRLEYEMIQTHSQVGHDIVRNVDFPWPVAQMILQHHERLDGSGYPAGLKGDEILPGARIITVADVVQAMSTRRPYRGPYGVAAALAEIERGRGRLYDPACVDACVKLFREKGFKLA